MGEMLSIDAKLKSGGRRRNEAQQILKLKKDERGVFLTFPDGTEFGLLNNLASKALEDILTWPTIETDGFVEVRPLRETLGRATKPADAKTRVSINIYGGADAKEKVGKKLSKERIYLQKPDSRRHGTTYDNPHIITFPDFQITNLEMQQEEEQEGATSSNSVLHFEKTISQVYASLTRGTNLQRIEGDGRLRTKLLEYVHFRLLMLPKFCDRY
jgi:SWI/SNF-related matrix-associated actin-dependent regulator of chromatin subfamily A3